MICSSSKRAGFFVAVQFKKYHDGIRYDGMYTTTLKDCQRLPRFHLKVFFNVKMYSLIYTFSFSSISDMSLFVQRVERVFGKTA